MTRKKERDPESTWYKATDLLRILEMGRGAFKKHIEEGLFPQGIIRRGEKTPSWTEEDLDFMQYRLRHDVRFVVGEADIGPEE